MSIWHLYILRCADQTLYTGITTNVERRFAEHSAQGPKCAKYLRGKTPLKLVYSETVGNRSEALKRELAVKALPKEEKERFAKTAQGK